MKILSIETSCDDTGISILECNGRLKNPSFKVLANISNSQIKIHAEYGGVFPALAKREHIKNLPILLEKILSEQGRTFSLREKARGQGLAFSQREKVRLCPKRPCPDIDLIAVTYGPGLEPALWTGIVFAKELAEKWKVPLVPVNHMEGHIFSVFGKSKGNFSIPKKINFPILSLLVSGGHTELVLSKKWMQYEIIGKTLDDAAGEAYDKVARMLGLTYPGGPQISKLAEELRWSRPCLFPKGKSKTLTIPALTRKSKALTITLPRPMLHSKNFDFSFSGLKTAVLYLIRDLKEENENILQDKKVKQTIALEFENAVTETLVYKTLKAKEKYKAKTIIVGGGVACNKHLQRQLKKAIGKNTKLFFPQKELTGDNSIMIGMAGYLQFLKNKKKTPNIKNIKADGNLKLE